MENKILRLFITKFPRGKANRYIRQKGGAVFKPWHITAWEALALWEIENQLKIYNFTEPFTCKVSVDIVIFLPDRKRRDIDNMLKTLWDTLEKAGIIQNDSLIHEVHTIKHVEKGLNGIFLKIRPYEEHLGAMCIDEAKTFLLNADVIIVKDG